MRRKTTNVRIWRVFICCMLLTIALMSVGINATAEGAGTQDAAANTGIEEYSAEELSTLMEELTNHPEITDDPEIGTWYRITPEGALSSDGTQWHGLFRKGSENKVIVYFYGGGVSIDNHSAANPDEFYNANCLVDGLESFGVGFPADVNPFHNWTVLTIPYANGDFHAGAGEFDYEENGKSGTLLHHGYLNYTMFMRKAMEYIGTPDAVLITGFSAGGFGTALLSNDALTNYFPTVENQTIFIDSALLLNENWHDIAQNVWHTPQEIVDRLITDDLVLDSLKALSQDHPKAKMLFGCSVRDGALASVQNYMDTGINEPTEEFGDVFQGHLKAFVAKLQQLPNTASFIWDGYPYPDTPDLNLTSHTIESLPTFFMVPIDDTTIAQWTMDAVNGTLTNHGIELLDNQY